MISASSSGGGAARSGRVLHVGFLALTDAAPFAVAQARGLFHDRGLTVELHREIGWATLRDKLIYGELDAAQAPAPMLWSVQLGINCPPCDVLTALVLNLHGNALTLAQALWDQGGHDDTSLRAIARERRRKQPLTFGVVFPYSSHHLMLLRWLREIGIEPNRDARIVIVPPAQMFRNLAAGTIDGFCAGEPWNTVAVRERIGWCRFCTAIRHPGHIEKVLMVTRSFVEKRAPEHAALVAALVAACAWCDEPHNRDELAELLSGPRFLNTPARVIAAVLQGRFDFGNDHVESVPDFHIFHRGEANIPAIAKAIEMQADLVAAELIPSTLTDPLPRRLFREDLYQQIILANAQNTFATSSVGITGS